MTTKTLPEATPDISTQRQQVRETILRLMAENTLASIREAQEELCAWLEKHPDDYMMREAGEVLAMSEEALLTGSK